MDLLIPPGATEEYLPWGEGTVRLLTGGVDNAKSQPLILVHGGGWDHSGISWYHAFEDLGSRRRLLAVDLPGFGGSNSIDPLGGPDAMADFVADIAQSADIERAAVVGVSMGGDVAMNIALRHPNLVSGLLLVAPGGLVPRLNGSFLHFFAWTATKMPDSGLLWLSRLSARFIDPLLNANFARPDKMPSLVREEFIAQTKNPRGGLAFGRYNQATIGFGKMNNDLSNRVGEIAVPTLFFHGEEDATVSPESSIHAAARMPNARCEIVEGVGHWAQLEAREKFAEAANDFLTRVDAKSS